MAKRGVTSFTKYTSVIDRCSIYGETFHVIDRQMPATPSSDISFYFDAPTDQPMATYQDLPPPIAGSSVIHDFSSGPILKHDTDAPVQGSSSTLPVPHPNGSEGWLPTEETQPVSNMRAGPPQDFSTVPQSLRPGVRGDSSELIQTDSEFQNVSNTPKRSNTATSKRASSLRARSRAETEGRTLDDSAFSSGAGTTGPLATAEDDDVLQARGLEAHNNLTAAQKSKISREECDYYFCAYLSAVKLTNLRRVAVTGKRLAKIIKQEAKTEKVALAVTIKELENMQLVQKNAVKVRVSHVQSVHALTISSRAERSACTGQPCQHSGYLQEKRSHISQREEEV